jgi:hypothetical protein
MQGVVLMFSHSRPFAANQLFARHADVGASA